MALGLAKFNVPVNAQKKHFPFFHVPKNVTTEVQTKQYNLIYLKQTKKNCLKIKEILLKMWNYSPENSVQ